MQRTEIKVPAFAFSLGLIILFTIIAASCSNLTPLTSDQTTPEFEPTVYSGQVVDLPASVTQLSAGQHLDFEHISSEHGLSQNTVCCILQDNQGFMWFGTAEGLNKYDGYTFTVYKHNPENSNSLSDSWIWALYEDHLGMVWIGTRDGGLVKYDRESDQFTRYQYNPDDPHSLSSDEVLYRLADHARNDDPRISQA